MTLEETIEEFETIAKEYAEKCKDKLNVMNMVNLPLQDEFLDDFIVADANKQVAEWLRELKAYREARKEITRKMNSGQWSEGVVYGLDKAVRIMEKHLREVKADE